VWSIDDCEEGPMRALSLTVFAGLLGGVVFLGTPRVVAGPDEVDAAGLFRARCASCHTVPDPALRTDRAWLDQVHRTA